MQSLAPQFLPEKTKPTETPNQAAAQPEVQIGPQVQAQAAPEAPAKPALAVETKQAVELNTDMMNEIIDDRPAWKRGKVMAVIGAAALLAVGIYWMNNGDSAAKVSPLDQQSDDSTFEAGNANNIDDAADEVSDKDSKPLFDKKIDPTPVPKDLAGAGAAASSLAFAGSEKDDVKQTLAKPEIKSEFHNATIKPATAASVAPAAKPVATFATSNAKPETKAEVKAAVATVPSIHFSYNQWTLTSETKLELDRLASRLKADKLLKLRIDGHADERGTEKYNYKLGLKRANTAKAYLVAKGISAKRLTAVSFGKSRPVIKGHDEQSWAQNRRVELRSAQMLLSRR